MRSRYLIMRPDEPHERREATFEKAAPTLDELHAILDPILGTNEFEHVNVLADFKGGLKFERADMFVDENGIAKRLPVNGAATVIYRRNWLLQMKMRGIRVDPEDLDEIYGTAILFERIVWT